VSNTSGAYRVDLNAEVSPEGAEDYRVFTSFDGSVNESVFVIDTPWDTSVSHAAPNSDGSFSVLTKSNSGSGVAWGDDTMGGILAKSTYDSQVSAYSEFYGADGALISRSWGDNDLSRTWFPPEGERFNLANLAELGGTQPLEFWVKDVDSDGYQDSYSLDGTNWSSLAGYDQSTQWWFVWVATDGVLTEGDTEYYWSDWDAEKNATRLIAGYQVPAAETFLGESLYMSHTYPLKRLLPLADTYSDYAVAREEGETHTWTWTDWDGVSHDESWTSYQYFLDNQSAGSANVQDEYDIQLPEVHLDTMYFYDHLEDRYAQVKAPMVRVDGALPDYYTFSDQTTVDDVTTRIMSIYDNELAAMSLADYTALLVDLSADPRFDELK
ncbi:MAG: hypothetical protein ACOC0O_02020, partial [Spirochaetota bacterium]